MLELETLVELLERFALVRFEIRVPGIVTSGTGDHHRLAFRILFSGIDQRHTIRLPNGHGMKGVANYLFRKRSTGPVPLPLQPR